MADEVKEVVKETKEEQTIEGLDSIEAGEREMLERHGVIDKEESSDESEEQEADEDSEEEQEKEDGLQAKEKNEILNKKSEEKVKDIVDVDNLTDEQEHEALSNFNKNEKALYWKQKKEKQKRQEAQTDRDYYKMQLNAKAKELEAMKAKLAKKKSVDDDLDLDDDIDIDESEQVSEDEKPLTKKDLEEMNAQQQLYAHEKQAAQDRVDLQEQEAISTLFDGDEELYHKIADLGKEVISAELAEGEPGIFGAKMIAEAKKKDGDVVSILLKCAKTHDKYYDVMNNHNKSETKTEEAESIKKIKKNTMKRTSSAALGGSGNGKPITSYDDMSYEQFAALPHAEYVKVPKEVRQKFLSM